MSYIYAHSVSALEVPASQDQNYHKGGGGLALLLFIGNNFDIEATLRDVLTKPYGLLYLESFGLIRDYTDGGIINAVRALSDAIQGLLSGIKRDLRIPLRITPKFRKQFCRILG